MVIEGMDEVDKIASAPTDYNDRPRTEQRIKKATAETFGVDYPSRRSSDPKPVTAGGHPTRLTINFSRHALQTEPRFQNQSRRLWF